MAKRRRNRQKKVRLAEEVSLAVGGLHRALEEEIIKAMHSISEEIAVTMEREMRAAGIQRSDETGSIERSSKKKQVSNERYGSVYDIKPQVRAGKGNKVIASANDPTGIFKLNFSISSHIFFTYQFLAWSCW